MRRQLTTSDPTELCVHDHVAWCGDGIDEFLRVAVSAFSTAAKRGERMVLVSEQPDPGQLAALDACEALMDSGALQLTTVEGVYREISDIHSRLALVDELLAAALADGHSGICVVADNSQLAAGSDEEFAAWLAWEATVDQLQATRHISGVCYFDRLQVSADRLADLAALHPVLSAGFAAPSFQLYLDGDAVRVFGDVDSFCAKQLRRILASAPVLLEALLDVSETAYIDHRALLVLNQVAAEGHAVRVRGAKAIVQRVWELLDVAEPALEFC